MQIGRETNGVLAVRATSMTICAGIGAAAAQGGKAGVARLCSQKMSPEFYE